MLADDTRGMGVLAEMLLDELGENNDHVSKKVKELLGMRHATA